MNVTDKNAFNVIFFRNSMKSISVLNSYIIFSLFVKFDNEITAAKNSIFSVPYYLFFHSSLYSKMISKLTFPVAFVIKLT